MVQEITVDLRHAPDERWNFTADQQSQAIELLNVYNADLGIQPNAGRAITASTRTLVSSEHWLEIESLSRRFQVPLPDIIVSNLYYDLLKLMIGCTAFAVNSPDGVLHARNLDWWTRNAILGRYSAICHFVGGPTGPFTTIGWPGFIGAFSGVAPGRFGLTLNAVLSTDPMQLAAPVSFALPKTFEEARSFEDARTYLSEVPLASDCLLLLTGTQPGELVVIERTPARAAIRTAESNFVCVANNYLKIPADAGDLTNELAATSCQRFERIRSLLAQHPPKNADECLAHLRDGEVKMGCTVQQMVFNAATGQVRLDLPNAECDATHGIKI